VTWQRIGVGQCSSSCTKERLYLAKSPLAQGRPLYCRNLRERERERERDSDRNREREREKIRIK
jgi:hypothetical protein